MKQPKKTKEPAAPAPAPVEPAQPMSPLAAYRAKKGLTLKALGEQLGEYASTIMRWENGTTKVPIDKLARIKEVTGLSKRKLRPDIFEDA